MNIGTHPDHFFAAIEHAFSLLEAGVPVGMLSSMSRSAAARGLADAASGYDHVRLRMMGIQAIAGDATPGRD